MTIEEELLKEQKITNQKLDQIINQNKLSSQFFAGLFHSLGSTLAVVALTALIIYIISLQKIDFIGFTSKIIQDSFSRIDWTKIIPAPKVELPQFRIN